MAMKIPISNLERFIIGSKSNTRNIFEPNWKTPEPETEQETEYVNIKTQNLQALTKFQFFSLCFKATL